jgi:hypothetical protein
VAIWAWCTSLVALSGALASAAHGLVEARRAGRARLALRRLARPTVWLFAGYLLVAALVTPRSDGETVSPLLGLALALPVAYALATCASLGEERPRPARATALAMLHGGAVLAAAAVVLALTSPAFVPAWLR